MIAIIDFNIGNLAAVSNMLRRLGFACETTADPGYVAQADRLILPGNGAFDACMRGLRATGLIPLLEQRVLEEGIPLLSICVGAQMLGHGSEEGREPGLGWLDLRVRRFPSHPGLRIPHMGWNQVRPACHENVLSRGMEPESRFYFIHSYYLEPADPGDVLFTAHYGMDFAAGVSRANIAGVQFHPEKSHRYGKHLLHAFAEGAG